MAASTTAATIFQAAEAQMVKDALENEESDEERALKAAAAREAKLKQVSFQLGQITPPAIDSAPLTQIYSGSSLLLKRSMVTNASLGLEVCMQCAISDQDRNEHAPDA